jgi:RNAse (barnase) inhibitor barstar
VSLAHAGVSRHGRSTGHYAWVDEFVISLASLATPDEFYADFFARMQGSVPDYGGRNLDALLDDLGDVERPVTLVFEGLRDAYLNLGDWLDQLLGTLASSTWRSGGRVTIVLRAAQDT